MNDDDDLVQKNDGKFEGHASDDEWNSIETDVEATLANFEKQLKQYESGTEGEEELKKYVADLKTTLGIIRELRERARQNRE